MSVQHFVMIKSKDELLQTLGRLKDLPVLVVGDVILDRYVWGGVERISPEAPVPVVEVKRTEDRLGGAGNVALNLANLGCRVSICSLIGGDEEGQIISKLLEKNSIGREGLTVDRGRPTSLKTRVIAHRQQIVRIDREMKVPQSLALQEGFAALVDAQIDESKVLIVSDYGKGAVSEVLMRKLEAAKQSARTGLKIRPVLLDPHPRNYGIYRGINVVKPNRREAELASGISIAERENAVAAGKEIIRRWSAEMAVITLGEDGLVIVREGEQSGLFRETLALEVFDVSGAGDTVAAVFGAALGAGADSSIAGDLANAAAGVVVSEIGTVPVDIPKLRSLIDRVSTLQNAKKK